MKRTRIRSVFVLCTFLLSTPLLLARDLGFDERVQHQREVERVYYRHQTGATRPFAHAVPRELLEQKVLDYLKLSALLEQRWGIEITSDLLRGELERIAAGTRLPDRLRELYAALGNDRFLIEECLARPVLVRRLARQKYAFDDRLHATQTEQVLALRERLEPNAVVAVEETRESFVIRVGSESSAEERSAADPVVRKRPWDEWWHETRPGIVTAAVGAVSAGGRRLPEPGGTRDLDCLEDHTWDNGSLDDVPDARENHSAVWTGSVMLIWGGAAGSSPLRSGSRYDPVTDSWTELANLNAPARRQGHTAVWTGAEMIVWGGEYNLGSTGGRYDPIADSWTSTSIVGAPSQRGGHIAVWTGTRMLVWGGQHSSFEYSDGASYDPATDSWQPVSNVNAPEPRYLHTAVWSGDRMLVWGGKGETDYLSSGGSYDPGTDTWTPIATSSAPSGRYEQTAVWTGDRMVVWGGWSYPEGHHSSGGIYDPDTDTWLPTTSNGSPSARRRHTAVWAGDRMLVWGGGGCTGGTPTNSGRSFDPQTNSWQTIDETGAPTGRCDHSAVWTGERMIVWGGQSYDSSKSTGGRYDPATDSWIPTATGDAPLARYGHSSVWTGNRMIVWGGDSEREGPLNSGSAYDPVIDSWHPVSTVGAPEERTEHTAVWSGDLMLVWGGVSCFGKCAFGDGGRYDPLSDTWTPISGSNAPSPRGLHSAVWTGERMIVWGGNEPVAGLLTDGGVYRSSNDSWGPLPTSNAPLGRIEHSAVWSGEEMLIWGGRNGTTPLGQGKRYNPSTNSWLTINHVGRPSPRYTHAAVWAGGRVIVWGGYDGNELLETGGRYDPATDSWQATSTVNTPSGRYSPIATATNLGMLIWGGSVGAADPIGGYYRPDVDVWWQTSADGYPSPRGHNSAVWTGRDAIFWGGYLGAFLRSGGRYAIEQFEDVDNDGLDVCDGDCNDVDPSVFAVPSEIDGLIFTGKTEIIWSSDEPGSGVGTVYDLLYGDLVALPLNGYQLEGCLENDYPGTTAQVRKEPEPGQGLFILIRGDNSCGPGSYGAASDMTLRSSAGCP